MTIHEIRESLEQRDIRLDSAGFGIIQKKINLNPQASRHTMVQCDLFQDTIVTSASNMPFYIEFFVSPLPIIYSNMPFLEGPFHSFDNRGPSAAVDIVLFKSILSTVNDGVLPDPSPLMYPLTQNDFPNQTLGTLPTFSWYSPELYITAIIHGFEEDLIRNLGLSFYIAVDAKKVSPLQAGLGIVREGSIAQGMTIVSQGREIKRAANVGQVFPMWKHGGTTPERMIRADALSDFFLQYHNAAASEKTMSTTNIRSYVRRANQMQQSGTAFGSLDPTKGQVPDWIKLDLVQGLVTGPLRPQWPPNKYFDNGNVMTL